MMDLQKVAPSQIARAYMGKPGCMCGCRGKYYTSTKVDHSNVDPKMVTKILRIIQANEEIAEFDPDGCYIAALVGGKEHCIYFKE